MCTKLAKSNLTPPGAFWKVWLALLKINCESEKRNELSNKYVLFQRDVIYDILFFDVKQCIYLIIYVSSTELSNKTINEMLSYRTLNKNDSGARILCGFSALRHSICKFWVKLTQ